MLLKPTSGTTHDNGIIDSEISSFTLEWFDISLDSLNSTTTNIAVRIDASSDVNNNTVRNCLLHDKYGNPGSQGPHAVYAGRASSGQTTTVQNNIMYTKHKICLFILTIKF